MKMAILLFLLIRFSNANSNLATKDDIKAVIDDIKMLIHQMDKRFEQVDKKLDLIQKNMDKKFEER